MLETLRWSFGTNICNDQNAQCNDTWARRHRDISVAKMKTVSMDAECVDAEMCCGRHAIGYQAANVNACSFLN